VTTVGLDYVAHKASFQLCPAAHAWPNAPIARIVGADRSAHRHRNVLALNKAAAKRVAQEFPKINLVRRFRQHLVHPGPIVRARCATAAAPLPRRRYIQQRNQAKLARQAMARRLEARTKIVQCADTTGQKVA